MADQVLLSLCYWREYRSQFHVASSFGVSEATACRTIKAVEEILMSDKRFHLPGKKALHNGSLDLTVIVVDASEQRIERPQKNSAAAIPARKSAIPRKDNPRLEALQPSITATTATGRETAEKAVMRLIQRIKHPETAPGRVLIPGEIIERESVMPIQSS